MVTVRQLRAVASTPRSRSARAASLDVPNPSGVWRYRPCPSREALASRPERFHRFTSASLARPARKNRWRLFGSAQPRGTGCSRPPLELPARQHEHARLESAARRHRRRHPLRQASRVGRARCERRRSRSGCTFRRRRSHLLEQPREVLHRQHVSAADVDASQQGDVGLHASPREAQWATCWWGL